MIKPPLFGKDSSPQYTAPRVSAIGTAVLTLVFFLCAFIVPAPESKPKYETVRIVLDTTPVLEQEKTTESAASGMPESTPAEAIIEEAPAPAPEPVKTVEPPAPAPEPVKAVEPPKPAPVKKTEPAPAKKVETKKAESKPAPKKTESKPKVEEKKYTTRTDTNSWENKKTMEELMAEQAEQRASKSSSTAPVDPFAQFDDEIPSNVQTNTVQTQKKVENALGGSAATATSKTTENKASSTVAETKTNNTKADSSTSKALGQIGKTSFQKKTFTSGNSSVDMKIASSTSGQSMVEMTDGSSRTLVKPKEPKISIDPESAKSVEGSPTVTISFTVREDGSVPESSVKIIPASLLPENLKSDIAWQLSTWRFEPGTSTAICSFAFTIKKN